MPVRKLKPITNGTRNMSKLVNDDITKSTPEKSLTKSLKKNAGRNNQPNHIKIHRNERRPSIYGR